MNKPEVNILPYKDNENKSTGIYLVEINGVKTYRCIGERDAENIKYMIDALFQFKTFYDSTALNEVLQIQISPSIRKTEKALRGID